MKARIYFSLLYILFRYSESIGNRSGSDFGVPRPSLILAQICCVAIGYLQKLYQYVTNLSLPFQFATVFLSAKATTESGGSSSPKGIQAFAGRKT
jgi:hypothetical protein